MTIEFKEEKVFGENLNNFSNLFTLEAEGAEDLASQIKNIKFPVTIISIVTKGTRFYAFLNASRPVTKKKVK